MVSGTPRVCHAGCMLKVHFLTFAALSHRSRHTCTHLGRLGEGQLDEDMYNAILHHVEQAGGSGQARVAPLREVVAKGEREHPGFFEGPDWPRHGNQYGIECIRIYYI